MHQNYQIYNQYYRRYKNDSTNSKCCFIIDIDFGVHNLVNYGVQSYIDYCKRYGIDLVVQKKINPKYIMQRFVNHLNGIYYAYTITQIFFTYQLLQQYNYVMVGAQNDIIIKPQTVNYFQNIDDTSVVTNFCADYSSNVELFLTNMIGGIENGQIHNQRLKLLTSYFGISRCNVVISLLNIIFPQSFKDIWKFQIFVQFLQSLVYPEDSDNRLALWDCYVGAKMSKLYLDNKLKYINGVFQFDGTYRFETTIMNDVEHDLTSIIKIVSNSDVQYIHFAGGGLRQCITDIRYKRMEMVYNFLN